MPWREDITREYDDLLQWEARRDAADRQVLDVTPQVAANVAEIAKMIPWVPKGVAYSMARAGIDALSTPGGKVAYAALQARFNRPHPFVEDGELVPASANLDEQQARVAAAQNVGKDGLASLGFKHAGLSGLGDLVSSPKNAATGLVAGLQATHDRGNILALGDALTPDAVTNPVIGKVRGVLESENPIMRGLKQASRAAAAWGDYPRQYAQAQWRTKLGLNEYNQQLDAMGSHQAYDPANDPFGFGPKKDHWYTSGPFKYVTAAIGAHGQQQLDISSQTEIGAAQNQLLTEGKVDQGTGFFVGGRVKEIQHEAEQRFGYITYPDGTKHAHTIGRDIADVFASPGTKPYTVISGVVDGAVAFLSTKPSVNAAAEAKMAKRFESVSEGWRTLAAQAEGRKATVRETLLDNLGATWNPARRAAVDPQRVAWGLESKPMQRYIEKVSETTGIRELDRLTGGKLDPSDLAALAENTDPAQTKGLLYKVMSQGTLTPKTGPWDRFGFEVRNRAPEPLRRLTARLPSTAKIDTADPRTMFDEMTRQFDLLKIPEADQEPFLKQMAAVVGDQTPAMYERFSIMRDAHDYAFKKIVEEYHLDAKAQAKLHKTFRFAGDQVYGDVNYYVRPDGQNKNFFGVRLGDIEDRLAALPKPSEGQASAVANADRPGLLEVLQDESKRLDEDQMNEVARILGETRANTPGVRSEFMGRYMPQPDWEEARKQVGILRKLHERNIDYPLSMVNDFQNKVFKPAVVTRPALTVKVLGEVQTAMTLGGLDTIGSHPLSSMAWVIGDSAHPAMLDRFAKGGTDIMGRVFAEQDRFAKLMGTHEFYDPKKIKLENWPKFIKGNDGWLEAAADQLASLRSPTEVMVANTMRQGLPFEEAFKTFWNDMAEERQFLAEANKRTNGAMLLHPQTAEAYLRDHVWQRIIDHTGGNPELIDSIVTGQLRGERIFTPGTPSLNPGFVEHLKNFANDLPDVARGPRSLEANGTMGHVAEAWDRSASFLLHKIFINRERTLARSPALRQMYFDSALKRASILDPADAEAFTANLEKAGMKKADVRQASFLAKRATDMPMSLEEVDHLAWAEANDKLKFYLEDLHARRQWVKAIETVAPFAHVWSESLARWGAIMASSERPITQVSRAFRVLRDPQVGDLAGVPDDVGPDGKPVQRGLFYKDQFGHESIAFPLSGKMMGLFGAPVPLHGQVKGLNLAFDFVPAVGPIASIPLAALSDRFDDPKYDTLRSIIFPRGVPSGSLKDKVIGGTTPTWLKYATQPDNSSQIIDSMRYLASTGNYRLHGEGASEAEANRLFNDAKQISKATSIMRAIAVATAPTAPSPEWYIEGDSGNRLPILTLVQDLQKMRTDDPQNATLNFITKYGDNALLLLVGKTVATTPGALPPTAEAEAWLRQNKGLQSEYNLVYGLFAPHGGDFNFDAYRRILESGDREKIDPRDLVAISNDIVAKSIYYSERAKIPNPSSPASALILRNLRDRLAKNYPGYDPYGAGHPGVPTKAEPHQVVDELQRVVDEGKLASHPAINDLARYLKLRSTIVQGSKLAGKGGLWFADPNVAAASVFRDQLWQLGTQLAANNKDFAPIWEAGLRDELLPGVEKDLDRNAAK